MKNLKLSTEISVQLKLQFEDEVLRFSAIDIERNRFFFASSSNLIYTAQLPTPQNAEARSGVILSAQVEPLDMEPDDFITSFDYLMEKESLIIGTSSGLLLLLMVDGNNTEIVGRLEGGVKSISPSPDGDLLAVTTGLGQLLVLTHDWDVLHEVMFEDPIEGIDVREQMRLDGCFNGGPISWRGDGKYLATLSRVQGSPLLQIKVWERDSGVLQSTSESKALVDTVLEWMPSGAKIATVSHGAGEDKCPSILFYERNGLERSSFSINESREAVVDLLKWNCNSDILAGIVKCENYDCIKIWSFSNNHWYLKQEIRYSKQDLVRFMWDPAKPLQLLCWTTSGQITVYNFVWISAITENSVALVVDHSNILVTPLTLSLIPPPMYSFSLKFSCAVREIAFYSKGSKNMLLAAYLSDGHLCVVGFPELESWEDLEGKEFVVKACNSDTVFCSLLHLQWLDSHILLGASQFGFDKKSYLASSKHQIKDLGYHLVEIEAVSSEDQALNSLACSGWHAKVTNQMNVEHLVISIASNPAQNFSAFVQLNDGNIFQYVSGAGAHAAATGSSFKKHEAILFSPSCPWMNVAMVNKDENYQPLIFGLDELGRLSVNGRALCNNCNSFSFYSNSFDQVISHLILSTKQDLLFIVDVSDILAGNTEVKYENFTHIASKRREKETKPFMNVWERGAKVVGVLHGDEAAVILQTSRGNLECICPRKLVLTSITNALVQGRYRDALLMVRRHRIDFNIIVDYCGRHAFVQFAPELIKQVNNLSYITDFVCAINNENMTEKLYKSYISLPYADGVEDKLQGVQQDLDSSCKVSSVLSAIRRALEEHVPENPSRELCILTTLARSDPPALEEALERIKVTRELELSGSNDLRRASYPSAEEALKHLLWLSDSDAVFEAALGLYDLNLAAIVALNAQRDPKEFLPFLHELEGMPTLFRQYTIDLRLQRYEKSLKHIVSAGNTYHEECMNLLRGHPELFPLGLKLLTDSTKRAQIYEAWGDHLVDKKCFEDAAMTFLCCSNFEKALKAYRACAHWRGVLTVAGLLNLGKEDVLQLAQGLSEELQALGKPGEAARVSLEYCGDLKSAVSLFVSARLWEEALRVAFMSGNDNLILEVKTASLECAEVLINEYQEGLEKVGKYLTRYLAVRQRRLLLIAKIQFEDHTSNIDDDGVSETSSNFSGMSAYTTGTTKFSASSVISSTTSKARGARRQRKRGKIRAGSADEEMALVEHLKGMAIIAEAKVEVKSLLACLLMLGLLDTATKVQHMAETFQLQQMAAVKLAEDAKLNDVIDEHVYSLDRYIQRVKGELQSSVDFAWRSKMLPSS
ncbi:hypothetical protein V2J09_001304 [Rumex salicifolius]